MSKYTGAMADEVFVGNVQTKDGIPDYLTTAGLRTARLGELALDINGNKIDAAYMLPMFIDRDESDAYNRIMMKRTFPNQHGW